MVHHCFMQAQFAVAAYADFDDVLPDPTALVLAGMTASQSREFAACWRVAEQYTDARTGVSATLFQPVSAERKYLAVRSADGPVGSTGIPMSPGAVLAHLAPQYQALRTRVLRWHENGLLAPGFTVTGHAFGGALAAALAAEFEHLVTRAYLYYADSADEAVDHLARALGIPTAHPEKLVRFPR